MAASAFARGLATVGVASLVMAGAASAAVAPSDTVITGCYLKATGILRIIDVAAGQKCLKIEQTISWNQTGPAGPAGAVGAQGATGAAGAARGTG